MGGGSRLRSYFDGRFKAKYTRFAGLEIGHQFDFNDFSLEVSLFEEYGQASDKKANLDEQTLFSRGGGLKFIINDNILRLNYAKGSNNSEEWHLVIGDSW